MPGLEVLAISFSNKYEAREDINLSQYIIKAASEAQRKPTLIICIKTSKLMSVGKLKCWKNKT